MATALASALHPVPARAPARVHQSARSAGLHEVSVQLTQREIIGTQQEMT
ncbi:hypothetical protein PBI_MALAGASYROSE_78 [Mycobacterium phage MalagasyRose]|uniref:Uncharacterized protein n=1 Tax=Mycobacterium phage MalagasyRose TaxID=2599870 RepID=A0A5J6TDM7_9CAUD|nr:hypothetical protein QEH39_gp10 [Mycobacterium phage MalagasyRose]QFG08926.1 hypothetical protein PBI_MALAGASYROSE_78 [Mycobacterium phage MalagasyRose]